MNFTSLPAFFKLINTIQNYPWGSSTSLNTLFEIPNPEKQPQAELWMGAHPNGCSLVEYQGQSIPLSKLIAQHPDIYLSERVEKQFGELPYLFKVLAAGKALSIQVHPDKQEAEAGFDLEERNGIARDSARRNYRDANHKPELVYALTPYQAMNGFRSLNAILANFMDLNIKVLESLVTEFSLHMNSTGLETFFTSVLLLDGEVKQAALSELSIIARQKAQDDELFALIIELAQQYPNDIGLFAPLFLNVLTLQPGEAMYLDARTPHAYLKGTGLEVMANSDNVLRAGLTGKNIDVAELAKCTLFEEKPAVSLRMEPVGDIEQVYPIPVDDFKFSLLDQPEQYEVKVCSGEILFAIDSAVKVVNQVGENIVIQKGESVFIPAYVGSYAVSARGRVARVFN